ncbi:hypothetical protein A5724_01890 [Mycobacterium sp. ACS1612]|uniref:hypothetical protein n=1 Tax=Mycobacterium sp. ACS1612 TaxID=1834117 RepID=UPI0007FF0A47|nr:hypothetical protein [Mycobacterium sp. ACS1612]OBF32136.1 hypothetical protein A5724_01890 [Mycobacterium sp. ACS1612]
MLEHNGRSVPGPKARLSGAGGSVDGIHWVKNSLLAVIAICALAGIVSTASMGQTQAALAIGIVAMAFFSRAWC